MLDVQINYNSALGVLRQDENRQPKIWKTLDIDPERQMLPLKEFRGRMTGTTPTFTQVNNRHLIDWPIMDCDNNEVF